MRYGVLTGGRAFMGVSPGFSTPVLPVSAIIATTTHPAYTVEFEGGQRFQTGVNGPLRFIVRRVDRGSVGLPTNGSVTLTLPDGSSVVVPLDREGSVAAVKQAVSALYMFVHAGFYALEVAITLADGTIVATARPVRVFVS